MTIIYQFFFNLYTLLIIYLYRHIVVQNLILFHNLEILWAISLQSLKPLYPFSLNLDIFYQLFDKYLRPINHAFLITKPNISFLTSILIRDIALQSL